MQSTFLGQLVESKQANNVFDVRCAGSYRATLYGLEVYYLPPYRLKWVHCVDFVSRAEVDSRLKLAAKSLYAIHGVTSKLIRMPKNYKVSTFTIHTRLGVARK